MPLTKRKGSEVVGRGVESKTELCWEGAGRHSGLESVPLKFMFFLESQTMNLFANRVIAGKIN